MSLVSPAGQPEIEPTTFRTRCEQALKDMATWLASGHISNSMDGLMVFTVGLFVNCFHRWKRGESDILLDYYSLVWLGCSSMKIATNEHLSCCLEMKDVTHSYVSSTCRCKFTTRSGCVLSLIWPHKFWKFFGLKISKFGSWRLWLVCFVMGNTKIKPHQTWTKIDNFYLKI